MKATRRSNWLSFLLCIVLFAAAAWMTTGCGAKPAEDLVSLCLTRLGVRDYFEFLLSCESVGTGKNRPDVYFAAAERLGAAVENTVIYEDAWYAVRTAKNAGFRVVAIYDHNSRARWDEIQTLADTPIESWAELLEA